jgi:hypothetical protein
LEIRVYRQKPALAKLLLGELRKQRTKAVGRHKEAAVLEMHLAIFQ